MINPDLVLPRRPVLDSAMAYREATPDETATTPRQIDAPVTRSKRSKTP